MADFENKDSQRPEDDCMMEVHREGIQKGWLDHLFDKGGDSVDGLLWIRPQLSIQ